MPYMEMDHGGRDPRDEIFKRIGMKNGKIPTFQLVRADVLCGIYERPSKTKSGIHLADTTVKEDKNQGKAALVLAMGPGAFVSDDNYTFTKEQQSIKVGDWITLWVYEGRSITVKGQHCRIVRDQDIIAKVSAPDFVF